MLRILVLFSLLMASVSLHAKEYEGKLLWHNKVALGFIVSGVVQTVPAQVGGRVKKGDPLVALDQRLFQARTGQAAAVLEAKKLNSAEAAREYDRAIELYERTQLSDHEKQIAEIGAADARAELKTAEAKKVKAELELEYSTIRAPFDAIVVLVDAVPGKVLVSELQSSPLVVVADAEHMLVSVLVSESTLNQLKIGEKANVTVQGDKSSASIVSVGMEPWLGKKEPSEPLYEVKFRMKSSKDSLWREGMSATVEW